MRKTLLLVLTLVSCTSFSQEIKQDSVYSNVEIMPKHFNIEAVYFFSFVKKLKRNLISFVK